MSCHRSFRFPRFAISLLVPMLLIGIKASATHIFGGELLYTHLSGNTYKITLTLYNDCAASASGSLPNAQPFVKLFGDNVLYNTLQLDLDPGSGQEVTPVCSSQLGNTSCNGGSLPGVRRYSWSTSITLASGVTNWSFIFEGQLGTNNSAGRSSNITNVVNVGSQLVYLVATLNTSQGFNNSPHYTTIPTPFYCINTAQQYNQGAVDPDGDNLSFALTDALVNGSPVTYVNPYSGASPMGTVPGSFSFNMVNGQMDFTANLIQNALVVNKVSEYRNGVLIGTSLREMTFIILGNCQNTPPIAPVSGIAGADTSGNGTIFTACKGTPLIAFHINASDPDGTGVTATVTNLPFGATLIFNGNGSQNPILDFSWNTTIVAPGNYTFFVTYKDNDCPLSSQKTVAYTIQIVEPNHVTPVVIAASQCIHRAYVQLNITNGIIPRTVVVKQGGNTIHTYTDNTGIVADSFDVGNYTITISSANLSCITTINLTVVDSGTFPSPPLLNKSNFYYCVGDAPQAIIATATNGATLKWYDSNENMLSGAPSVSTTTPGIFTYYVSQQYGVCESLKDTIKIWVTTKPVSDFDIPPIACSGDTVKVDFTGSAGTSAIYHWDFSSPDFISGANAGPYAVNWQHSGNKAIKLVIEENHCFGDTISKNILVKPTPFVDFSYSNVCINDSLPVKFTGTPVGGASYHWDFAGGTGGNADTVGNYTLHWSTTGDKTIVLTSFYDGCADTAIHKFTVYPAPVVQILNRPEKICLGELIFLHAIGGLGYTWYPKEDIFKRADSAIYTRVMRPTVYTVKAHNEYGCNNADSIIYNDVEPCCNFSIPNAFTPNGDGHNDQFRIVSYGNMSFFDLRIFNRWGQLVFESANKDDSWNGKFNGKDCDMGIYFYYFKAKCLTGHEEERKGDLLLYR